MLPSRSGPYIIAQATSTAAAVIAAPCVWLLLTHAFTLALAIPARPLPRHLLLLPYIPQHCPADILIHPHSAPPWCYIYMSVDTLLPRFCCCFCCTTASTPHTIHRPEFRHTTLRLVRPFLRPSHSLAYYSCFFLTFRLSLFVHIAYPSVDPSPCIIRCCVLCFPELLPGCFGFRTGRTYHPFRSPFSLSSLRCPYGIFALGRGQTKRLGWRRDVGSAAVSVVNSTCSILGPLRHICREVHE